ncbi:putative uncharacterized protein [Caballeronia insecticola]|uniref:Pectate lyase superfamily protein domain-containing protein n=1 Tax=Caballeronia insecticola TaxID=758793 RepID=R4WFL6_9BURK|nr:putative uncharacterized protein [Caballeronia insecticola]
MTEEIRNAILKLGGTPDYLRTDQLGTLIAAQFGRLSAVDSISALRGLDSTHVTRAIVTGYYAPHDGGGGIYEYDASDKQSADNGGTVIVANDAARWKLCLNGDSVTARQFGLKGDGVTDDAPANRRFLTACMAQNLNAQYTDGVYLFATTSGSNNVLIPAPSGIVMYGVGNVIFKAADGLNSTRNYGFNFIGPEGSTASNTVNGLTVRNITFDHNGANNLPRAGQTPKNAAVLVLYGSDITVEDCATVNNPGRQGFSFGTADANGTPTCSHIMVRRIRARNVAQSVPGNTVASDHSTVYVIAQDFHVFDVTCWNDSPCSVSTCVEFHGSSGHVDGIRAYNYAQLANFAALVCDTHHTTFGPDLRGEQLLGGITFWCAAGRMLDAKVTGGYFRFRYNVVSSFNALQNVAAGANFSLSFCNVDFAYEGGDQTVNIPAGLAIGNFKRLVFNRNRARGILGRALQVSTPDTTTPASIEAIGNVFEDCSNTTLGGGAYNSAIAIAPAACVFDRISISGNTAKKCKTYLWVITDAAITINELESFDNMIDASMKQTGSIGWNNPVLAPGSIQLRHTDNMPAEPSVRASVGSVILDATTGVQWERIGAGESRVGWAARSVGNAPPTTNYWSIGSRVLNAVPATGQPEGWVCVTTGTPGTWKPLANIQ